MMVKEISCFSDFNNVIDENVTLLAHTKKNSPGETLGEHIMRCNKYFNKILQDKNLKKVIFGYADKLSFADTEKDKELLYELFYQMIIFHDTGKVNPAFQKEKMNNPCFKNDEYIYGLSGSDHSFLSSLIYMDYFLKKLDVIDVCDDKKKRFKFAVIEFSYIISRHHSDLTRINDYFGKIADNYDIIDFFKGNEAKGLKQKFSIDKKYLKKLLNSYERNISVNRNEGIAKYFLLRLAYSVLVSCDYYSTTEYMDGMEKQYFGTMEDIKEFYNVYKSSAVYKGIRNYEKSNKNIKISDISDMNELRSNIFLNAENSLKKCISKSDDKENIFFLEAPTGSGKSNTALNLSFMLMENRKKLFYVYPFNTLVEQNKNVLYKSFNNENLKNKITVINSITPIGNSKQKDDTENYYKNALLDRQFLNYPFILTTHVSFFSALFGDKRENLFSFLQLIDSVVVLDEIQSYKNSIWAEIIIFLKECADLMNIKIIIMSATLPELELLAGADCNVVHLLKNSCEYFNNPVFKNRVKLSYELIDTGCDNEDYLLLLKEHIKKNCGKGTKILVEFIKKSTAEEFYQDICCDESFDIPVFLITGDDSALEREKILKPIREKTVKEALLIATQVIEAGEDIDMDIGYKDISILDSEEQFLGRINRSFSAEKQGVCYFFNYDSEKGIYKNDYRNSESLSIKNPEMRNILEEKRFSDYYRMVIKVLQENKNNSTSKEGLKSFFDNDVAGLDFKNVSERMKLIDENLMTVDVVLCRKIEDENGKILDGWQIWNDYKKLLRNNLMDYSEKQVKLSQVRSLLNNFIYSVNKEKINALPNDKIGELLCYENGEDYFENGKFKRSKLEYGDFI